MVLLKIIHVSRLRFPCDRLVYGKSRHNSTINHKKKKIQNSKTLKNLSLNEFKVG